jgi:hypothetical protein
MYNSDRHPILPHSLSPSSIRVAAALILFASIPFQLSSQSTIGWTPVSPGFSPQALLEHEGAMWAAGSDATIAVSTDSGLHWKTKYHDPRGGLLLSLAFVGANFGYAAGAGPHLLTTTDGGDSWTGSIALPEATFQAAFGDTKHGVVRTRTALLSTIDGGKTWKPVSPENDPDWMQKYPFTVDLAALDGNHLIVRVSEGEAGDGEFLWTANGGATWNANYLPHGAGGGGVFVEQARYWSIGGEVVGSDQPGGGLRIPMAVRSNDGIQWEHLPVFREACHWAGCGGCTPQGCFAGGTFFVPFSRLLEPPANPDRPATSAQPSAALEPLDRLPKHMLSNQWARGGSNLCLLTQGAIECTTLTTVETLDTKGDLAQWDHHTFPPLLRDKPGMGEASIEPALPNGFHCIRCNLTRIFVSKTGNSGPVPVQIALVISPAGEPQNVKISGDMPEDVAAQVRTAASGWLFEPYLENGKPKSVPVSLHGQVFVMNFDKPPHVPTVVPMPPHNQ